MPWVAAIRWYLAMKVKVHESGAEGAAECVDHLISNVDKVPKDAEVMRTGRARDSYI